jgi:predicted PurR-regulated permease PerM
LALLVGARVAGILGIFLAIPIAGVIVSLFEIEEMQARVPVSLPRDPVSSEH